MWKSEFHLIFSSIVPLGYFYRLWLFGEILHLLIFSVSLPLFFKYMNCYFKILFNNPNILISCYFSWSWVIWCHFLSFLLSD